MCATGPAGEGLAPRPQRPTIGAVKLDDQWATDRYGVCTVARWGGYLVQIMPMLYNDRLILTPEDAPMGYDYGWCYAKGGHAFAAAALWNPDTEAEPMGYIKAIRSGRRAGERA